MNEWMKWTSEWLSIPIYGNESILHNPHISGGHDQVLAYLNLHSSCDGTLTTFWHCPFHRLNTRTVRKTFSHIKFIFLWSPALCTPQTHLLPYLVTAQMPPVCSTLSFLFQMPSWCNHQILLACTMMGQQEKEQIHRRIIKITTSCKGKKEQGENIGEMMGGWGNRESLSKELTFELSPEGCEGARKTSGKAFQAAARETGNKGSQALDRTTCRLSGHWPWGVWDCF